MKHSGGWKSSYTAILIVFLVWILSYMDRMVMATAIPFISKELSLSTKEMGWVISAFFAGYALFQIPGGILSDRFGPRKVMVGAILVWSLFTALTGTVNGLAAMLLVRVLFGIGEGVAPAATWKALANWTPQSKRATANAWMMSSNSLGPALAPLFVVALITAWGWRSVFYVLFIPGLLLALWIWFALPDNPADKKGISPEELAEIKEDAGLRLTAQATASNAAERLSFWQVMAIPAVWKSFLILFFCNIASWGFISWLPSYLLMSRGLNLRELGIAASLPFFAGTIAIVLVGWATDKYFSHQRKWLVIVLQLASCLGLYLAYNASDLTTLIIYQTFTGFCMMSATVGVFSLPMSAVSKEITGRVMGIVNTAGQLAGFLSPIIVGYLVIEAADGSKNFGLAFTFFICSMLISAAFAFTFKQKLSTEKDLTVESKPAKVEAV